MKEIKSSLITKNQSSRLYKIPVPIIGLTGGIATGKSTVANLFRQKGIDVIDADWLVKSIYQKQETIDFIALNFPHVIDAGKINFKLLRETAFSNPANKTVIENYIYAHMPEAFLLAFSKFNAPKFIVYDVPLLFEKGLNLLVDVNVCVYLTKEKQLERLIARDNSTPELAESILKNQLPIDEKKARSQFVIDNNQGLENLEKNVESFLASVLN